MLNQTCLIIHRLQTSKRFIYSISPEYNLDGDEHVILL